MAYRARRTEASLERRILASSIKRRRSTEHSLNRCPLHYRIEVPVTPTHRFGLVPYKVIDQSLIHPRTHAQANERMAQTVPALHHGPLAVGQRSLQVIVSLIARDGGRSLTLG